MNDNAAGQGPLERPVRPSLLTEKELLKIVDMLIRDRAYNRPAAVAIGMAVGAAVEAEVRERCAKPVPDEWLVKVRRLVQGFEHVSGIARLWEPDYSSGSERALWSRATEACADVAKLLREAEGPNDRTQPAPTAAQEHEDEQF